MIGRSSENERRSPLTEKLRAGKRYVPAAVASLALPDA